jgi:hypothetical protein
MSLGTYTYFETFENAVNYAYDKGVFICASAGNDDSSDKRYPAGFENVTAVAATDCNDSRMEYFYDEFNIWVKSNYGDWVDVAAPGQEIFSTLPTYDCFWSSYGFSKKYDNLSGTSMAAPHVAGLAALLLSKNPVCSPAHLKLKICDEDNVDSYNSYYDLGSGRINAYNSLTATYPPDAPTIDGINMGKPGKEYEYTINSVDPDNDNVKYYIDWDDDETEWTDFYGSGEDVDISHTWSEDGEYTITAKAVDNTTQESTLAEFTVNIAENFPPYEPSNPTPANNSIDVDINADLSWDGGDPDDPDENITYDVYFGTSSDPPKVASNISDTNYDIGTMEFDTQYYWRTVSWDNHGASTSGPIWCFTTGSEPNDPPDTPSNPNPEDEATEVDIDADLSWECSDPNGDEVVYDLYLEAEDSTPDILVGDDLSTTTFDPGSLEYGTTYYWQIIAIDEHSASTIGPIWQFTTQENTPPTPPEIDGPPKGPVDTELCWTFHSDDENGHQVKYFIEWGDGTSDETALDEPCTPVEVCHTYANQGDYTITAYAEDEEGLAGSESSFEIEIPRFRSRISVQQLILQLFEQFLILRQLFGF